MKNKKILWIVVFLISISYASATLLERADDTINYYKLEEASLNYVDSVGNNDLGAGNEPGRTSGIISFGQEFVKANSDYLNNSASSLYENANNWSVSLWVYQNSIANGYFPIPIANFLRTGGVNYGWHSVIYPEDEGANGRKLYLNVNNGAGGVDTISTTSTVNDNQWLHIVMTWDGDGHIYFNASDVSNEDAEGASTTGYSSNNMFLTLGTRFYDGGLGNNYFDGIIDEVAYFNQTLTQAEITELFNSGAPGSDQQYPYGSAPSSTDYFTITATDEWNSTNIISFSVEIDGNNYSSNSTGHINTTILSNNTLNYDLIIFNISNYFNRSYSNYNISDSGNLNALLHQAEICLNATSYINNASVTDITYYETNGVERAECFNISSGEYNFTAVKTGWYNTSKIISVTALDNYTTTIENLTSAKLTVYARDANSSAYLSEYSLNISSLSETGWGGLQVSNVTNHSFYIINGSYTLNIDVSGYSLTDSEANITVTGDGTYTFWLNIINTVNVTFYNEDDGSLFTGIPINATFILDDTNATVTSTTNARLWLENLDPGEYEIRYYGTDCAERSYFFTLTNRTHYELNLYLLNDTGSEEITNTLYDEYGNKVEGYIIKLLRYYASENGYIVVDEGTTNSEGQTVLRAIRNSPYYKFRITTQSGTVLKTTTSTQIYDTTITHYITLGQSVSLPLQNTLGVSYDLTYLTTTNQFKYTWDNSDGTVLNAELKIYQINDGLNTIINSSSSATSSGTIYLGIPTINGTTYKAMAYVTFSGDENPTLLDSLTKTFDEAVTTFGRSGLFITILIIIVLSLLFAVNPAIPFIGVPTAVALTRLLRLHGLEWTWIISLFAVGLFLAYLTRDKT